jgi:hypothetical protein
MCGLCIDQIHYILHHVLGIDIFEKLLRHFAQHKTKNAVDPEISETFKKLTSF